MSSTLPSDLFPTRPNFTLRQLDQASKSGLVKSGERASRKRLKTFPIDDMPPEQLSDRDDGIFIEVARRGRGSRVHITIADVAAHVPAHTPLARAASQRGFTVYRDGGNSTMFPQELQDRLSLEDRQDRLGLDIIIDLDERYHPIHTEFQRVLTDTYATSYEQAGNKMATDPQFKLMSEVAEGVRDNHFGPDYDELRRTGEQRKHQPNASPHQMAATKLVELYMLLANNVTASFFCDAKIPFIYRNFDTGAAYARYSTIATEHTDLAKRGMPGQYSHVTSPIRRGPDFFNQHQMHFVMRVIETAETGLRAIDPTINRATLHTLLWKNTGDIVTLVSRNRIDKSPIERVLLTIAHQAGSIKSDAELKSAMTELTRKLSHWKLPYSTAALDEATDSINPLMRAEEMEARSIIKNEQAVETALRRLNNINPLTLPDMAPVNFSVLLRSAALTGILPLPLMEEARNRLTGANPNEYTLDPSADGLQIMIVASYPEDANWISLKKAMARRIKHDPATVYNILEMAKRTPDAFKGGILHLPSETSLPVADDRQPSRGEQAPYVQAALLTYQNAEDAPLMSAPSYSIGHNARAALSHANYSFLEHYAFGQLRPVDQISVPNLLYAELEDPERSRREVVEEIANTIGAKLTISARPTSQGKQAVTVTLQGGSLPNSIVIKAEDVTIQAAQTTALKKLLRAPSFKNATSFLAIGATQRMLDPHLILDHLVQESGGHCSITVDPVPGRTRNSPQCRAEIEFHRANPTGGKTITITRSATGPNKDRAVREAANLILLSLEEDHHVALPGTTATAPQPNAESWVKTIQLSTARSSQLLG